MLHPPIRWRIDIKRRKVEIGRQQSISILVGDLLNRSVVEHRLYDLSPIDIHLVLINRFHNLIHPLADRKILGGARGFKPLANIVNL